MSVSSIKTLATRGGSKALLLVKKYSPEILMALGAASGIGSTIMACKATTKVKPIVNEFKEKRAFVEDHKENAGYKKEIVKVYLETGGELAKEYWPAVSLLALSLTCNFSAHGIMRKRNAVIAAAYKMADQAFKDYRRKVVEQFGEDKDRELRYDIKKEIVTSKDEEGNDLIREVETTDPTQWSQYARFFDDGNDNWSKTPEYNLMFLRSVQNWANDKLNARGHLFLNEVYEALGMEHSQAGALVGWVKEQGKDGFVDFGIYNICNRGSRDFVNGIETSILLDFNVDGVIYDLI